MKRQAVVRVLTLLLLLSIILIPCVLMFYVSAQPAWPSSWIEIDWDRNENGLSDDWRDVKYAYYQYDSSYLFLKLRCYSMPGSQWPTKDARYKWFIDLDGNMYYSGGNTYNAEYVLFVEDTDNNGVGELYLLFDTNNDNKFNEYEPWPPTNYANYKITNVDIGGFRTISPNQIDMYISWASIGNPSSYGLFWTTDQQDPNLDASPTTDRVDEGCPICVHNVAAINQTPTPTTVTQGEHVSIQAVVENKGTKKETFNVACYFDSTLIGTKTVTNLAAAHQSTLTFDWDTTGIPVGTYSIKVWADSSAAICETDECDNWCTAPATVTILSAAVHDVAATSQVPDKTSVLQGTTVNINVTVSNLGDFTETFQVTCYYDNTPIATLPVTNLIKETSTNLIFTWDTTGVTPGTYYIRAMADSGNVITEANEDNNNCTSLETVTVYSAGQMGNLSVDKTNTAVISGEDPPVVGFPTVYELTIIVTNIGGSSVSNVIVYETISSDATFVSVGTPSQGSISALPPPKIVWNVGTLTAGASATLTFRISVTPTSISLLYLNHKEDLVATGTDTLSGNPVSDSGDTDITVTPIVRDVAATSQVPSSTVVCQGDTVTIYVTVKNFGNVSETFDVACYYDSNLINVIRVYNLAANSQTVVPFAWSTTGVPTGTYSIEAHADSSYEISETDETNNVCTSPSAVEIVIHDIAIISQGPSATVVPQGETVTIFVTVRNEGTEVETFTVSVYINDTLFETKTVTDMQPSTTTTLYFYWDTTGVQPATYFINTEASVVPGEKDTSDNACRSVSGVTVTMPLYEITFAQTGVSSDFKGTVVIVDGTHYNVTELPQTFTWYGGSNHTFSFQSPLTVTVNSKQYVWVSTTGLSTQKNGFITVITSGTITGNYKTQYYLNVTSEHDSPTPSSDWYDDGTAITASVTSPSSGPTGTRYVCTGWTGTGSVPASGTSNSVSFTITMSSSITWNWKTQYLLTVVTNPPGLSPQPSRNPAGESGSTDSWWYDSSVSVTLTAQSITNYVFNNWDVDGVPRSSGENPISVIMNAPHTTAAHYTVIIPYTLTITTTTGGSPNPIPGVYTYSSGTSVSVTAVPSAGYRFDHWVLDGSNAGSANPISILMNVNHNLQAVFAETHVLTISVSQGGTTNPTSGTYTYQTPTNVLVTATPNTGYRFDHWAYDGSNAGSQNPITVYVGSTHTLQAVFVVIPSSHAVGGYSTSLATQNLTSHVAAYTMLLAVFVVATSLFKRKRK